MRFLTHHPLLFVLPSEFRRDNNVWVLKPSDLSFHSVGLMSLSLDNNGLQSSNSYVSRIILLNNYFLLFVGLIKRGVQHIYKLGFLIFTQ